MQFAQRRASPPCNSQQIVDPLAACTARGSCYVPALFFMQKREVMYGPQTAMEFEENGFPAASGEPSPLFAEGEKNLRAA